MTLHEMPFARVELCVFAVLQGALTVLLVRREEFPQRGRWALPGGVIRADLDVDLDASAARVARERLQVSNLALQQHGAVGGRHRDLRGPGKGWALSIVYRGLIRAHSIQPEPGKRVTDLTWMPVEVAAAAQELAFDHGHIVRAASAALADETNSFLLPFGLLPPEFTLTELQEVCELVIGRRLDKSSFRRRLEEQQLVERAEGLVRRGPNRPAQIFRERAR